MHKHYYIDVNWKKYCKIHSDTAVWRLNKAPDSSSGVTDSLSLRNSKRWAWIHSWLCDPAHPWLLIAPCSSHLGFLCVHQVQVCGVHMVGRYSVHQRLSAGLTPPTILGPDVMWLAWNSWLARSSSLRFPNHLHFPELVIVSLVLRKTDKHLGKREHTHAFSNLNYGSWGKTPPKHQDSMRSPLPDLKLSETQSSLQRTVLCYYWRECWRCVPGSHLVTVGGIVAHSGVALSAQCQGRRTS